MRRRSGRHLKSAREVFDFSLEFVREVLPDWEEDRKEYPWGDIRVIFTSKDFSEHLEIYYDDDRKNLKG